MQRVVLVSLLFILQGSTAISQGPVVPNKAEEALRMQQGLRPEVLPRERRGQQRMVEQIFTAQIDRELEAKQLTVEFAIVLVQMHRDAGEQLRVANLDRLCMQLAQNAEARIPPKATAAQRAKLRAAAGIDVRRRKTEFVSRINLEGVFFVSQFARGGGEDMFGPDSLFAKVMRQQGLQ